MEKTYCTCNHCGHKHILDNREIAMFAAITRALYRVYKHCKEKGSHEFKRKEVKHLFGSESVSARFGDWVWFGGLVYKTKKAHYGLNMERCDEFFSGRLQVPTRITIDPVKNEIVDRGDYKNAKDFPELFELLNQDGEYMANYKPGQSPLL